MSVAPLPEAAPLRPSAASAIARVAAWRWRASVDQAIVAFSVFWALSANGGLAAAALREFRQAGAPVWSVGASLLAMLVAVHVLLLAPLAHRHTAKPLLAVLTLAAAAGSYFIGAYGIVLDPAMVVNVLHTDTAEARELVTGRLALHMALFAGPPLWLLWRTDFVERRWREALRSRLLVTVAALAVLVGAGWSIFQPLAAWTRNHRETRYLVTPANIVWSSARALVNDAKGAARPREAIGLDAKAGPSWAERRKPLVVVLVVGETARDANWGLSGYARHTTPQLERLPVVNLRRVAACGTDTETSLPCMFAPVGRRDYDGDRIRGQESLLHVLARAGVTVQWRDNQSGCKGVCDGLPAQPAPAAPARCAGGRCLDDVLVDDLDARLKDARGTQFWVLHMLGSHGPAYSRRHPAAFGRFLPECRDESLQHCTAEEITNAYDNSLLYTDDVLARAIGALASRQADVDSALVYVSDHGESLGEHGLYLHGLPYRIAPPQQTEVPMVWWTSPGFERAAGLRPACLEASLRGHAPGTVTHDHLFHTLLGMLDVQTALHEPSLDLTAPCRAASDAR